MWHINDLYNENAENWQSVSIQQQRINAETEEFLRSVKAIRDRGGTVLLSPAGQI